MNSENTQVLEHDCAVCLQKCHYPTQLPCGHVFCFLCVKGVAIQSKKCAMCRATIPLDYLNHPVLLEKISPETVTTQSADEFQWYYEGRNGWWKYDQRSNNELEAAYNAGEGECKLLLAGALYCIDFQNMIQVQSRDQTRRRRVKRDTPTLPAKGIAGIKITDNIEQNKQNNEGQANSETNEIEVIEVADDDNDAQNENIETVSTPEDIVDEVINRISSLDLHQNSTTHRSSSIDLPEDT